MALAASASSLGTRHHHGLPAHMVRPDPPREFRLPCALPGWLPRNMALHSLAIWDVSIRRNRLARITVHRTSAYDLVVYGASRWNATTVHLTTPCSRRALQVVRLSKGR